MSAGRIVLVCGGRDYTDRATVRARLTQLPEDSIVIQGGAPGADRLAYEVAEKSWHLHTATVKAKWVKYGKRSGPLRNAAMLKLKPTLVIAFPGGRGTENCIAQAEAKGIPVERVGQWPSEQAGGEGNG